MMGAERAPLLVRRPCPLPEEVQACPLPFEASHITPMALFVFLICFCYQSRHTLHTLIRL